MLVVYYALCVEIDQQLGLAGPRPSTALASIKPRVKRMLHEGTSITVTNPSSSSIYGWSYLLVCSHHKGQ